MSKNIWGILTNGTKSKRWINLTMGMTVLLMAFTSMTSYGAVPMDDDGPPDIPPFHYITGTATYGSTTPADGAQVTVVNERTMESLSDTVGPSGASGTSGEYLVDLVNLPSSFQDGDTIRVTIQGTGTYSQWTGFNSIAVDTDYVAQKVDIILTSPTDNSAPSPPTNDAPAPGATNVSINPLLKVQVSDPDGDTLSVSFYDASDNSLIKTVTGVESGSTAQTTWSNRGYSTSYQWYVTAHDDSLSTQSGTWQFTTQAKPVVPSKTKPGAPGTPQVTASDSSTGSRVVLTWSAPSSDGGAAITGYKLYRGTGSGNETLLETTGTDLTYTDTAVEANVTYYYQVSAVNGVGEGARSPESSVTTHDTTSPTITGAQISAEKVEPGTEVSLNATVTDSSGVTRVFVALMVGEETKETHNLTHGTGNTWSGDWATDEEGVYTLVLTATDTWGNQQKTNVGSFTVEEKGGIPGFELAGLVLSFIILLGAVTLVRHRNKA